MIDIQTRLDRLELSISLIAEIIAKDLPKGVITDLMTRIERLEKQLENRSE